MVLLQGWRARSELARAASTGAMDAHRGRVEPAVRAGSLVSLPASLHQASTPKLTVLGYRVLCHSTDL